MMDGFQTEEQGETQAITPTTIDPTEEEDDQIEEQETP